MVAYKADGWSESALQDWIDAVIEPLLDEKFNKLMNTTINEPIPLEQSYRSCVERTWSEEPFDHLLRDRYGRQVHFSHEKRKAIPQDIIDYIESQNILDTELQEYAESLYASTKAAQESLGLLQGFAFPTKQDTEQSESDKTH